MSTLNLIASLRERIELTLTQAGQDIDKEYFSAALQKYDEAIELMEQVRQISFNAGVEELVEAANGTLEKLLKDRERLHVAQLVHGLPELAGLVKLPTKGEMH